MQVESLLGLFNNTAPVASVIEQLAPESSLTLVSGLGHTGKTFFALEAMTAVARGVPFLGHFPTRRSVTMYVGEDSPRHDIVKQMRKLLTGHQLSSADIEHDNMLFAVNEGANFGTKKEAEKVAQLVFKYQPSLVVFDSLKALTPGVDENDATQMEEAMGRFRGIAQIGPAVVLLHHNTLASQRPRGSGAIFNEVDGHLNLIVNRRREWIDARIEKRRTIEANDFAFYHLWDLEQARLEFVEEDELPDPDLALVRQVVKERGTVNNATVIAALTANNPKLRPKAAENRAARLLQRLERHEGCVKKVSRGTWQWVSHPVVPSE